MSKKNNTQEEETSSRVIDSFIRRAVDEGDLDPDDMDAKKNVFWDKTTIRAAVGGLFVLGIVNLFFYYNMKVAQVDNTSDWIPERRGFLVEYREAHNVSDNSATSSGSSVEMLATLDFQQVAASLGEAMPEDNQEVAVENLEAEESRTPIESTAAEPAIETQIADVLPDYGSDHMAEIHRRIDMWAEAWSNKDVVGYLSYYSSDFISQGVAPFEPWAQLRFERISSPEWIHVVADDLKISVNGDSAVADFKQVNSSSDFNSESLKTLVFELEVDSWKIIRETVQPR